MTKYICSLLMVLGGLGFITAAYSQDVIYSETRRDELKSTNFEIIGKYNQKYLIYKSIRNANYVSVYNDNMTVEKDIPLTFIPDRIVEANVLAYPTYSYIFYQYIERGIAYEKVVKIGDNGEPLTQPIELDTTSLRGTGANRNKIYSVIYSDDKSKILVFKVNTRSENKFEFKTMLFDKDMNLLHTSYLHLAMPDRDDFLTDFHLDNDGNLVFGRGKRSGPSDNISKFYLIVKPAQADSFAAREISFDKVTLDEIKLRVDNYNNRYLLTGFYYQGRRGLIEGIANAEFDKAKLEWVVQNIIPLPEELREDARGQNNIRNAFNDYFIKDIIIRSDGAFLVTAEAMYETNRGGNYNRWDNFGNPFYSPYSNPYFGGYGGGYGSPWGWGNNNSTRYHTDNIISMAFDPSGQLLWSNTLRKSQYDDDSDTFVSYKIVNTGDGLVFLYNDYEKREVVLAHQSVTPEGKVIRNPTMHNLDRGYTFIPRFAKQVSSREVIIPCTYRSYLVFSKITF